MTKLSLEIELVPDTSWFNNVRAVVTRAQWDSIRKRVYSAAYDTCEICGGIGPKHPVECHEIWNYDDSKKLQKLEGMIALCPACHRVKHFGLARVRGLEAQTLRHFMKINKLTQKKATQYITQAFETLAARSKHAWVVDISHLKTYGIDITKIGERK